MTHQNFSSEFIPYTFPISLSKCFNLQSSKIQTNEPTNETRTTSPQTIHSLNHHTITSRPQIYKPRHVNPTRPYINYLQQNTFTNPATSLVAPFTLPGLSMGCVCRHTAVFQQYVGKERSVSDAALFLFLLFLCTGKEVGSGSFGNVYLGQWQNQAVAVKLIRHSMQSLERINTELTVGSSISHPNVVRTQHSFTLLSKSKMLTSWWVAGWLAWVSMKGNWEYCISPSDQSPPRTTPLTHSPTPSHRHTSHTL